MSYYSQHPEKAICLDTETTGIDPSSAEIVQLSIIDFNGKVLFNEYIKPDHAIIWPGAEQVHHISPLKVFNKPHLNHYKDRLKEIFRNAELIISYNGNHYDIPVIAKYGYNELYDKKSFDVMLKFAPIYGAWNSKHQSYTWQKLSVCADYYGYRSDGGSFHDSLEDIRATLFCYKEMTKNNGFETEYDNTIENDSDLPYDDDYWDSLTEEDGPSLYSYSPIDDIENNGNLPYDDDYWDSLTEENKPSLYSYSPIDNIEEHNYNSLAKTIFKSINKFNYIDDNYTHYIYEDGNQDFLNTKLQEIPYYKRILLVYAIIETLSNDPKNKEHILNAYKNYYDDDDFYCHNYIHTTEETYEFNEKYEQSYIDYDYCEYDENILKSYDDQNHITTFGEVIDKFDDSEDFLFNSYDFRGKSKYADNLRNIIRSFFDGTFQTDKDIDINDDNENEDDDEIDLSDIPF